MWKISIFFENLESKMSDDGEESPAAMSKSYITRGKLNPDKEAAEKRNKKNSLRRVTIFFFR